MKFTKKRIMQLLPAIILLVGGGLAAGILFLWPTNNPMADSKTAAAKLTNCQNTSDFKCYQTYFKTKTADEGSLAALQDLRNIYGTDAYAKSQCHQITHVVGRAAFIKYGSLEDAYAKGDSFCWSGYYHGITEQAIGKLGIEGVKTKANTICSKLAAAKPYSFDHYNCAHGLGHGFLTVASFKLFDGLKTCDLLHDDWERKSCYGGIYMENIMVVARGEGTTEYLKPDQPLYPCTAVDEIYKDQCYLMQTSYALQQNNYNFGETFRLCRDVADAAFTLTCYQSIGRDASGSTVSDQQRTLDNCHQALDDIGLENCMLGAVRDFISYYHSDTQAKALCDAFGEALEPRCLQETTSYYATF